MLIPEPIFFSTVKRGEGSKRKLITIKNEAERDFKGKVKDVEKPEWLDVEEIVPGGAFTVASGEKKKVVVNINPTHRFFPSARVLDERVLVKFEGDYEIAIPITLQEVIDETVYYRGVFAMDFGTTNTCYAWKNRFDAASDPQEAFAAARTSAEIPTLIYFKDVANPKRPKFKVGVDAQHDVKEFAGKIYAYFISIKRLLGQDKDFVVMDDRAGAPSRQVWKVEEIASYFIQELLERAEKELGGEKITHVTATHPTLYSTRQKEVCKKAFELALARKGVTVGADNVVLKLDEANAAAFNFIYNNLVDEFRKLDITQSQSYVLTFDFGGGTIDVSLIHAKIKREGVRVIITTDLKGVTGEPRWAGDNVTLELFKVLKRKVALEIARERTAAAKVQAESQKKAKDIWEGAGEEKEAEVDWFAPPGKSTKKKEGAPSLDETLKALGVDISNDEEPGAYQAAADLLDGERAVLEEALAKNDALAAVYERRAAAEGRPYDPRKAERLEEAIETLVPTKFHVHADVHPHREAAAKELFYELWHEAETLKLLVVASPKAEANVSQVLRRVACYARVDPKVFNDRVTVKRSEMDRAIRPVLEKALRKAHALYKNALADSGASGIKIGGGKEAEKVPLKLLLAGNSCKLPLVKDLVREIFQIEDRDVVFEPKKLKKSVAQGAAEDAFLEKEFGGTGGLIEASTASFLERFPYSVGLYHRDLVVAGYKDGFCPIFRRGQGAGDVKHLDEANNFLIHGKLTDLAVYADFHDDAGPVYLGKFDFRKSIDSAAAKELGAKLDHLKAEAEAAAAASLAAGEKPADDPYAAASAPAEADPWGSTEDTAKAKKAAEEKQALAAAEKKAKGFEVRFEVLPSRQILASVLSTGKNYLFQQVDKAATNEENPFSGTH